MSGRKTNRTHLNNGDRTSDSGDPVPAVLARIAEQGWWSRKLSHYATVKGELADLRAAS